MKTIIFSENTNEELKSKVDIFLLSNPKIISMSYSCVPVNQFFFLSPITSAGSLKIKYNCMIIYE